MFAINNKSPEGEELVLKLEPKFVPKSVCCCVCLFSYTFVSSLYSYVIVVGVDNDILFTNIIFPLLVTPEAENPALFCGKINEE